jgi:hypothetical protein
MKGDSEGFSNIYRGQPVESVTEHLSCTKTSLSPKSPSGTKAGALSHGASRPTFRALTLHDGTAGGSRTTRAREREMVPSAQRSNNMRLVASGFILVQQSKPPLEKGKR